MRRSSIRGWAATGGGVSLIAGGVIASLIGLLTDARLGGGQPVAIMLAGGQAIIIGVGLVCYRKLMLRTTANDEALRFQYDIGYEAGWQERDRSARVVVDMEAHRCHHSHLTSN